eukprot:3799906-Pyramimonas_sp.AAC.1
MTHVSRAGRARLLVSAAMLVISLPRQGATCVAGTSRASQTLLDLQTAQGADRRGHRPQGGAKTRPAMTERRSPQKTHRHLRQSL